MEELLEIKEFLKHGQIEDALALVQGLEEMGKKGISHNIRSYAKVLLLHLIKIQVEKRTTKSWDVSIRNSVAEIIELNARPKERGSYLNEEELIEVVLSAVSFALSQASLEAVEGVLSVEEIQARINTEELLQQAFTLLGVRRM